MNYPGKVNAGQLYSVLRRLPHAVAVMQGGPRNRYISGTVKFYRSGEGVLVVADIQGLPAPSGACKSPIFAFHIHSGLDCGGNGEDPFANAGTHYNPSDCPHPYHSGDMPPLFGAGGRAFLAFLTDRFTVREIIGKTVIIHDGLDDFTTQPSGNAGNKIACGVISKVRR
jgi:Cu-Zn family superoxide dismutase